MIGPRPTQEFFSIGEVCALTDLKPHVLRYWESQFRFLSPAKNRSGNRVYKSREVEMILLVKHLLYAEKYTIDGARQRVEQFRRTGECIRATGVSLRSLLQRQQRTVCRRTRQHAGAEVQPERRVAGVVGRPRPGAGPTRRSVGGGRGSPRPRACDRYGKPPRAACEVLKTGRGSGTICFERLFTTEGTESHGEKSKTDFFCSVPLYALCGE